MTELAIINSVFNHDYEHPLKMLGRYVIFFSGFTAKATTSRLHGWILCWPLTSTPVVERKHYCCSVGTDMEPVEYALGHRMPESPDSNLTVRSSQWDFQAAIEFAVFKMYNFMEEEVRVPRKDQ